MDEPIRTCALLVLCTLVGCASEGKEREPLGVGQAGGDAPILLDSGASPTTANGEVGGEAPATEEGPVVENDGYDADGRIVEACQSYSLAGMQYSPGGTDPPNKCAPFDSFTNNPYAVRCIDAMPNYETPYPGDQYCVLPPHPDQGFQTGVHPQGWEQYWLS